MMASRPGARALALACVLAITVGAHAYHPYFADVVGLSHQFYEAQMSGSRPFWSRVAWRSSSHLQDGIGPDGSEDYPNRDVTGGWYENGGYAKISFTMGASASLLAYGAFTWEGTLVNIPADGDSQHSEWTYAKRQVQWVADYFTDKAFYDDGTTTLVAQVGDLFTDDKYWGPADTAPERGPEGGTAWRPVWRITSEEKRGADVAAQAAAVNAAAALFAYRVGEDPTKYSEAAKNLYNFARDAELGVYIIPEGNITALSRTYRDDMTWAAGWLCRLQLEQVMFFEGNEDYCQAQMDWWDQMQQIRGEQPFLTSDVMHLAAAMITRDNWNIGNGIFVTDTYRDEAEYMIDRAIDTWVAGGPPCNPCKTGICLTPDNFTSIKELAPAVYTANMALVAMSSASRFLEFWSYKRNTRPSSYLVKRQCWAKFQMAYLLGDNTNKQAYVVGLDDLPDVAAAGVKSPRNPRHRGAACVAQDNCGSADGGNVNVLKGALVAGPGPFDDFVDSRDNSNSIVSIEYNAGFTGALLGLASLERMFGYLGIDWDTYCFNDGYAAVEDLTAKIVVSSASDFDGSAGSGPCGVGSPTLATEQCPTLLSSTLSAKADLKSDGTLVISNLDYKGSDVGILSTITLADISSYPYTPTSVTLTLNEDGTLQLTVSDGENGAADFSVDNAALNFDATKAGSIVGPFYMYLDSFTGALKVVNRLGETVYSSS